jgi:SAM-dependent methyltransferase
MTGTLIYYLRIVKFLIEEWYELPTITPVMTTKRPQKYNKRFAPSFLDHDWYILRSLRNCLIKMVNKFELMNCTRLVVDMGCGDSPYEAMFRCKNCRYVCCDINGEVDLLLQPGQCVDLPNNSADGVVSFQVLEHVWDLDWYLGECHRVLKPGGWLLLSTHGTWPYHAHPTDFRRWTRDGLLAELKERHFEVQAVEGVVGPLAWTTQIRLLGFRHFFLRMSAIGKVLLLPVILYTNIKIFIEDAITPISIRNDNACIYVTLSRKSY